MHIDPNLPCEWRGKVVKKNKAPDRYDVYVFPHPVERDAGARGSLRGSLITKEAY